MASSDRGDEGREACTKTGRAGVPLHGRSATEDLNVQTLDVRASSLPLERSSKAFVLGGVYRFSSDSTCLVTRPGFREFR